MEKSKYENNYNGNHKPYHVKTTGSILTSKLTPEIKAFYTSEAGRLVLDRLKRKRRPCTLGIFPTYLRFEK
jgi:hypothetical protein